MNELNYRNHCKPEKQNKLYLLCKILEVSPLTVHASPLIKKIFLEKMYDFKKTQTVYSMISKECIFKNDKGAGFLTTYCDFLAMAGRDPVDIWQNSE